MANQEFGFARTNPLSPWLPICTGFLAAEITASLVCTAPPNAHTSALRLAARAAIYLAVVVTAGILGTLLPRYVTDRPHPLPTRLLIFLSLPGWLFLPPIVLLSRQRSPWILLAVLISATLFALSLERVATLERAPVAPRPHTGELTALFGLPPADVHPGLKFLMAIAVVASALLAANRFWAFASLSLACGIFLAIWRWKDLTRFMTHRRPNTRASRVQLAGLTLLATLFALMLSHAGAGNAGGSGSSPNSDAWKKDHPVNQGAFTPAMGYFGVILLPPKPEKHLIVAPAPLRPTIGGMAKPVVIPFDGPYWYFKIPNHAPGRDAHIAHGKATEVNVRSTDMSPLKMEAHQTLPSPMDLSRCGGLDLNILNADTKPGRIAVDILLSDTTLPAKPPVSLGQRLIASSGLQDASLEKAPAEETLHFSIPRTSTLQHFNQITVLFLPDPSRARFGPRVAIQNFILRPR